MKICQVPLHCCWKLSREDIVPNAVKNLQKKKRTGKGKVFMSWNAILREELPSWQSHFLVSWCQVTRTKRLEL